ncbi:hypothetical protein ID866_7881 [Astraeus odoratus]|nr:hypothetical protein ID866_7881 [Astraeus odoratus]
MCAICANTYFRCNTGFRTFSPVSQTRTKCTVNQILLTGNPRSNC